MDMDTDSNDTISLYGDLTDIALGTDLDGITDNEEVSEWSEDGKNVTTKVKDQIVPKGDGKPKVASIVVIPAKHKSSTDLVSGNRKTNRNGSVKRDAKKSINKNVKESTLISMLSRVTVTSKEDKQSTPKRQRSPNSTITVISRPAKLVKRPDEEGLYDKEPKANVTGDLVQNKSFEDVSNLPLALKVCLEKNGCPDLTDLMNIKKFICEKIEEAMDNKVFVPILGYNKIESDGVYVNCPDSLCADWLYNIMLLGVPKVKSKVIVLRQSESIPSAPQGPKMVRTVVTVPSRKENAKILDYFAQLNGNLNTEFWRIANRRFKGKFKTILYMRMDEASFERIENQGGRINWSLGQVTVELERQKSKPNMSGTTSGVSKAQASSSNSEGLSNLNYKPSLPSPKGVMEAKPVESGLNRKVRSVSNGKFGRK